MIRCGSQVFQTIKQFCSSSECSPNGAKLRNSQQPTGNSNGENVSQVMYSRKVELVWRDESGSGGLIEKFLAVVWSTSDG